MGFMNKETNNYYLTKIIYLFTMKHKFSSEGGNP